MRKRSRAASMNPAAAMVKVWWKVNPKNLNPAKTRKLPRMAAKFLTALSCPRRCPALPSLASSMPMEEERGRKRCCPRLYMKSHRIMMPYVVEAKPMRKAPAAPSSMASTARRREGRNQSRADTKATVRPGTSRGNSRKDRSNPPRAKRSLR